MDLFPFGSTGKVVEMRRLEQLAFNAAFDEVGLDLFWNVTTYCELTGLSSGPESVMALIGDEWGTELVEVVLECKRKYLAAYLQGGTAPRKGVLQTLSPCEQEGVRCDWVTDRCSEHVELILDRTTGLRENMFDRIFTSEELPGRKFRNKLSPFVVDQFDCSTGIAAKRL